MEEDKKLDFNQPLLSVRRRALPKVERKRDYSTPAVIPRLPPHRSELKSGPIRNAGAIPFLWEQTPGQPKEGAKPPTQKSNGQPQIAPKLPPGRYQNATQQDCNKNNENVEKKEEGESSVSGDSSSDDGEYVDALDTLSRAESSFLNCSMTGISGFNDLDVKPSRSFFPSREFMMDRFLPAAKAMAIETPQYALPPKKQLVVQEKQQQVQLKKVANHEYKPSLRYGPSFAKRYSHYNEEEEASDDEYDRRENLPGVCGLLPRFCLKSSLCLLNPVPAMSVRTRVPVKSSSNKGQPRFSLAGSYRETDNASRCDRTELKSIDKIQTAELVEEKTKLRNDSDQLVSHSATYSDAPLPIPEETMQFGIKTFEELLAIQGSPREPVIEKTLYVDTVHKVELPNSSSFSPTLQETEELDQMHALNSSLEDFKKFNTIEGDFNNLSLVDKLTDKCGIELLKSLGENQDFELQVAENEAKESLGKELSQLPVPPPLPKSPSDSWLWRTLPSMSTKNVSVRSQPNAAIKGPKGPTTDIKWETMVKTTRVQRRHLHHSEESLTTIPEA